MQWEKPRENPSWNVLSANEQNTLWALLVDTLRTDFAKFRKEYMLLEDKSDVSNAWPYLPDLPLWTVAQMVYDLNQSPEQWIRGESYEQSKKGIQPFLEFWKNLLHVDCLPAVDYAMYHEHFFCDGPSETDEEVLGWDDEKSRHHGQRFRKIDRHLYVCVCRFDFEGAERELKAGANMDAGVDYDRNGAFFRIRSELSYLGTCGNYHPMFPDYDGLCDFIGQAAHQQMMNLLLRYDKCNE